MTTRIILFITLLAYAVIVSQSFMYMLSLKNVQLSLGADTYTTFRKLVDNSMRANFKYVIYITLLANLLLVMASMKNPGGLVFIASAIALVALIADIFLTLKGNLPINDAINSWSSHNIPSDWESYRAKWFNIFKYRQLANIIGFIALSVAAVFGKK